MLYNDTDFIITNANIVTSAFETLENASVIVENGIITNITRSQIEKKDIKKVIDAQGKFLGPGLIDMHIHGCGGYDSASVAEYSTESRPSYMARNIGKMKDFLCTNGITSFQLAIVPDKKILTDIQTAFSLDESKVWKNAFIGVYTEGPFINEKKKGGISQDSIESYSKENLDTFLAFTKNTETKLITCMTIAPETIKSDELYSILEDNNIKAAWGHSAAFLSEVPKRKNIHITHLFNAMTPLDHKQQGLAGLPFSINFQEASFELICDNVHVCSEMIELVLSTIGTKNLCLISDGMSQAGLPACEFNYMGKTAINDGTCCKYKANNLLIGSSVLINKTGQMLFSKGLITVNEFFQIASTNPARTLSLHDRGSIATGKRSDLVLADDDLNITDVFCS